MGHSFTHRRHKFRLHHPVILKDFFVNNQGACQKKNLPKGFGGENLFDRKKTFGNNKAIVVLSLGGFSLGKLISMPELSN